MEERRERPARDGAPRRRISPRAVLAAVLLVLLVAFVLDNTREVRVGYVIGDATMPLIIVLVVTAVVGGLIALLMLHRVRARARQDD
jgi:uncharacterized integral membrane protein